MGYTTALHELTHRFEQNSSARLTDAEAVFMWRRTTDHTTDRPQPFEPYLGDVDEPTRPDGFIDSYFGRHYPGGYGWEVLSTGIESIFAGRFGGLHGEGAWRPDEDHRRFTLGCMASLLPQLVIDRPNVVKSRQSASTQPLPWTDRTSSGPRSWALLAE